MPGPQPCMERNVATTRRSDCAINTATVSSLETLRALWTAFYAEQKTMGLLAPIPPDGFDRWVQSVAPGLGRFSQVLIVSDASGPLGFIAGRIRQQPAHFGAAMAGLVSDIYVQPSAQGLGLGRWLLESCIDWFKAQGITRLELQVVAGNQNAAEFYAHLGWKVEFIQLVRDVS